MAVSYPTKIVSFIGTGGMVLSDPALAGGLRDHELPPTAFSFPWTAVLDLRDTILTPSALRELIVPIGQRLRGGVYGELRLVVATEDDAVAEFVGLLAREHELPLFVARSSAAEDVALARPVGDLTAAERDTLQQLHGLGGVASVAWFAQVAGMEPSAATNRLVNLHRKGYVHRLPRNRRQGDLFFDPRASTDVIPVAEPSPMMREALQAQGIDSDPYDTSRVVLEGESAQRAAEILKRRGKAS
jgi:hypothetical protein